MILVIIIIVIIKIILFFVLLNYTFQHLPAGNLHQSQISVGLGSVRGRGSPYHLRVLQTYYYYYYYYYISVLSSTNFKVQSYLI